MRNSSAKVTPSRIQLEHLTWGKTLSRGSTCEVRVATSNLDNTQFAVKIIDRRTTPNLESVFRETQAFAKITQHPNIIKYHEVLHKSVYSYIILEFAPEFVSLAGFLQKEGRLSESMAYRIFVQLVAAIWHCHSQGVSHRDIKLENILIDPKTLQVKLIDFGLSLDVSNGENVTRYLGSPLYMSPEVLMMLPYDARAADVWSLGVILFQMIHHKWPFPAEQLDELTEKVATEELRFPDDVVVSDDARQLMKALMTKDPRKRITLAEVARHHWMHIASCGVNKVVVAAAALFSLPEDADTRFVFRGESEMQLEEGCVR